MMDNSINASNSIETPVIDRFRCTSCSRIRQFSEEYTSDPYYWLENEGSACVNPYDSLKTQVPVPGDTRVINGIKQTYVKFVKPIIL